jgi:REP element-mobilizing transposase RayT
MPRPPRDTAAGVHHVIVGAVAEQPYFRDDVDYVSWTRRLVRVLDESSWKCIIVCQLRTHAHLMLEVTAQSLPRGMHRLSSEYGKDFNERWGRRGALVRSRYWSRRIVSNDDLLGTYAYVAWNPVKAGLVRDPAEWPRSSFATSLGLSDAFAFVDASVVLEQFSTDPRRAREALREYVSREGAMATDMAGKHMLAKDWQPSRTRPVPTRPVPGTGRVRK